MVMRHADRPLGPDRVYTATLDRCPDCDRPLPIYQVDGRRVQGLDEMFWLKRRDKRCQPDCPGARPIIYAPRDLRLVLPKRIYGLDVTLHVGERHLCDGVALAQITRDLNQRGVPLDQRHTGRVCRDFVALTLLARGDDAAVQARLRAQGGIVLMCDGVQFEDRSPVLYLLWDARSGEPLFGERKLYRGADDLVPLLERVRAMNVPVIGVVTDKEKGLVPAVTRVFPEVPYQYCQTHFLKNCAVPLHDDLNRLQQSVRRRADAVRAVGKRLAAAAPPTPPADLGAGAVPARADDAAVAPAGHPVTLPGGPPRQTPLAPASAVAPSTTTPAPTGLTEEELARELCELVRVNSRVSGKAPLDPPELARHERLADIRGMVLDAQKKLRRRPPPAPGPGSTR